MTTPPVESHNADADAAENQRLDSMWAQRCATLSRAWVQVRYHRRRQRFFDLADKFTKSITVVLGASLMGKYFVDWLPWLATAITSAGLLALVFGYSERKQLHLFAAMDGSSYLIQLHRLAVYLQSGLLVAQDEEGLTLRATRDALAKLDAKTLALLPTSPANSKTALQFNVGFWADQGEALEKRFAAWAAQ